MTDTAATAGTFAGRREKTQALGDEAEQAVGEALGERVDGAGDGFGDGRADGRADAVGLAVGAAVISSGRSHVISIGTVGAREVGDGVGAREVGANVLSRVGTGVCATVGEILGAVGVGVADAEGWSVSRPGWIGFATLDGRFVGVFVCSVSRTLLVVGSLVGQSLGDPVGRVVKDT